MVDERTEVQQLEILCSQLYESQNHNIRVEAEKALTVFQNSPDALAKCQLLLERSESSYAQLLAATTITKLISRGSQCFTLQQRIDIRNYVLNYLATRPKLPNFVTQALIALYARISKLGWFDGIKDEYAFRNVISDVSQFLQGSAEYCMIGVQILSQLVLEINQVSDPDCNRAMTRHRRVASSFRDTQLFDIFRLSCNLLGTASENCENFDFQDVAQHGLITQCLRLAHNCLTFDFVGTSPDESSDDLCTMQIPTSWRPLFLERSTLKLFFDLYHGLPSSLSPLALSCLVQLVSIRRSLFNNAERAKYLSYFMGGVKRILENPQGLRDPNNYHEFCRLLARLKSNFQLGELVCVEGYKQTIELIANFTVESFQVWQFSPNSVHYLLSLWQRMVASVPYVKAAEPHYLDVLAPEVMKAFVTSRLEATAVIIRDDLDDPLDDLGMVMQQLEQFSVIARCDYEKTCALLVQLFDQTAALYQEMVNSNASLSKDFKIQEIRLTWLVYIIGSSIGGRVSFNTNDEHDIMDGEMVVRVLQLMALTDSKLPRSGCEKLELAFVNFFEQFKKIYVGDNMSKTQKIYKRLQEVMGIAEEQALLSLVLRKIITNLKFWGSCERVISKTLTLLGDLSNGYACVRKLVKLEEMLYIMTNHTSEQFPFLGNNATLGEMRLRTTFYTALGRCLMVEIGEEDDKFESFMLPIKNTLDTIGNVLATSTDATLLIQDEIVKLLIGVARDLRGLLFSFNTKASYMLIFDYLYPAYTPIFLRALELWPAEPKITTPVLKLFAEMVHNRTQRLQFDVASPHGILLFREASKAICTYGKFILPVEPQKDQMYPLKLKGICICFSTLRAALNGGYVNFGVFRLYGDESLDDALNIFVKLLFTVPRSNLLDYPKLCQSYYALIECLAQDHMPFLASLELQIFLYILSTISDGLNSLDMSICAGCSTIMDHIVTYLFKHVQMKEKKSRQGLPVPNDGVTQLLEMHAAVWQQILSSLLNIIIFDDCKYQWSLSRPLLGLILMNEQYFAGLREEIVRSVPGDKQVLVAQWLENLMDGVERNLTNRNRDKFTANLNLFKKDVSEKGLVFNMNFNSNSTFGDMMS